jgi:hypothetical protein
MFADQQTRLRRGVRRNPLAPTGGEPAASGAGTPQGRASRAASGGTPTGGEPSGGTLTGGGVSGNERLTAATGIALVVLLAVIGVTLLRLRSLISVHLFVGLVLIGPVALKMASTGYRFARYYTSNPVYRERGAPPIVLRLIAPVVVATSVVVLATGVALLFVGPDSAGILRGLHKASFIVWVAFTTIHMLGHLPDLQKTFLTERGGRFEYNSLAAGRTGRLVSLAGVVVAGVVLAIVLIPYFGAWSHFEAFHHH